MLAVRLLAHLTLCPLNFREDYPSLSQLGDCVSGALGPPLEVARLMPGLRGTSATATPLRLPHLLLPSGRESLVSAVFGAEKSTRDDVIVERFWKSIK